MAKLLNGAIGQEQLAWLEKELIAAQKKKEKVILACHFPLYPDEGKELLWNAKEVRTLIEAYPNVLAWFNGHVHVSQYFLENQVHYVSFRGMGEKEDNAFAIVSVYPDHIEIKGYGRD
jgi:manganese-dependent ADP-ribose/CDP-alcohol diphosphatase